MNVGRLELSLKVASLEASRDFYSKLGFRAVNGSEAEGYLILFNGISALGLYQGHVPANLLNFRGGDVFAVAAELEGAGLKLDKPAELESDGSVGAWLTDPDGNRIYLNTAPGEGTGVSCFADAFAALTAHG